MYKIMLADDEGIVIDALKYIIEKNFPDMCIIEAAKTGRNVIELAERFRPDIAFMDIQMPGINGIEAMKEIRKTNSHTLFIVISAYDKFDYAREAINQGVLEYVQKPIEQGKLVVLLKKAMGMIDTERERRSKDLIIREKLEIVVPIIESGMIYAIIFQENYQNEVKNYQTFLGIEEEGFMMVIKCGDEKSEDGQLTNPVGTSVKIQNEYKKVREIIKEHFTSAIIGNFMSNRIVIYVSAKAEPDEYKQRIEIIELARKMVRVLRKETGYQFLVGIGTILTLERAGESYQEAMGAFRFSDGSVTHYKDLPNAVRYEDNYPIELEKSIFAAVKNGDIVGTVSSSNGFFDFMEKYHYTETMDIKLKALEFVLKAESIAYESGSSMYHFNSRSDYMVKLYEMSELSEIRKWFITKMQEACRKASMNKADNGKGIVNAAQEYIQKNYKKDISLDDVSEKVKISPYYFSKIYKKETNENFIEYLTKIRMEKAKDLLENSGMSIKEICQEVGYSDPNYFSRSFKKNVGVTPTEYKESKN